MSIDLAACIGCGACTIACQAENNIPVVGQGGSRAAAARCTGSASTATTRGAPTNPRTVFQPVPCMQCEHAPVRGRVPGRGARCTTARVSTCRSTTAASARASARTTARTRCGGSISSGYAKRRPDARRPAQSRGDRAHARRHGEVQLLPAAHRHRAHRGRPATGGALRDGEVVTACQAVCPTRAIAFGDLADPSSEVNRRKRSPLDYALLAELNTRPRTTYLARIVNPAPGLGRATPDASRADSVRPLAALGVRIHARLRITDKSPASCSRRSRLDLVCGARRSSIALDAALPGRDQLRSSRAASASGASTFRLPGPSPSPTSSGGSASATPAPSSPRSCCCCASTGARRSTASPRP